VVVQALVIITTAVPSGSTPRGVSQWWWREHLSSARLVPLEIRYENLWRLIKGLG